MLRPYVFFLHCYHIFDLSNSFLFKFVYYYQVNLEYLGRVVFNTDGILYPDSVVGTDSHTTMIDGLGVAGWGVGGIEAEATMLGQVNLKWTPFSFNDRLIIVTSILC